VTTAKNANWGLASQIRSRYRRGPATHQFCAWFSTFAHQFPTFPRSPPLPDTPLLAADANTGAVSTDEFDGPLELLLFLVRQHGVDICTVPIAPITEAYLGQIKLMAAMELDSAGDFLVIAATLCLIKSREMFPRTALFEGEEDEEDPAMLREALALQLLEYERYKDASECLANRPWLGRDIFARPAIDADAAGKPIEPNVDAMGLLEIFYEVLQRSVAPPPVHEVERQTISMNEVAEWMIRRLQQGPRELNDLMGALTSSGQRVMAFICTLEMAKLGVITVNQSQHLGPVVLEALSTPDDANLRLLLGAAG
jgi:segregation and condensation protein A